MIPFFPTPYPDELLYSVIARYHAWSCNKSYFSTSYDLFGYKFAKVLIDLPLRLNKLCSNFSNDSNITPEQLIKKNTLYPLYKPYLPLERANKVFEAMKGNENNQKKAGVKSGDIKNPQFLRYCPDCLREDVQYYGEPYWHRTHQVFGVCVCPHHKTVLHESNVGLPMTNSDYIYPLSFDLVSGNGRSFYVKEDYFNHYLYIANNIYWLLNFETSIMGLNKLSELYKKYLQEFNFADHLGKIKHEKLIRSFVDFYGIEFLAELNSQLKIKQVNNWLKSIFWHAGKVTHPIRHLLLKRFLNTTPKEFFFKEKQTYKPFGDGPWPCLNPASSHYNQLVINDYTLTKDRSTDLTVGFFSCECGYTYSLCGADWDEKNKFRVRKFKIYGPIWENELLRLAIDEKMSLRKIGDKLNVSKKTVMRQLRKLMNNNSNNYEKNIDSYLKKVDYQEKKEKCRKIFLDILKKYPEISRTELRRKILAEFAWLKKNDFDWLNINLPEKVSRDKYKLKNDWSKKDDELSKQVAIVVKKMEDFSGRPVRITKSSIARRLGNEKSIIRNLSKLPKTKCLIDKYVESLEDFQIRRVKYVVQKLLEQGVTLRKYKIKVEASLSNKTTTKGAKEEINKILNNYLYNG